MVKIISTLILLILFSGCTTAPPKWSKQDLVLQTAATTALAIDWLQTKEITRNDNFQERNPILGKNPTQSEVDLYFLGAAIGSIGAVHFTKSKYRPLVQTGIIGAEIGCILYNHSIGVKISF